jgi:hypothetical protein
MDSLRCCDNFTLTRFAAIEIVLYGIKIQFNSRTANQ